MDASLAERKRSPTRAAAQSASERLDDAGRPHPRVIGSLATTALAIGGSNQSLFLIGALIVGQGNIPGQGSAAVPLLIIGILLSWAAAPGWIELVLMSPNRVGGIAAVCTDAFRRYSPVLSALTGLCYWWGWVPTCGLTAIMSATAINAWVLPMIPVDVIAIAIVCAFVAVNVAGIRCVAKVAIACGFIAAGLAFMSALIPVLAGRVDWHQALSFHLTTPFPGWFGGLTSLMAGLYLTGFAAPAFEAATCHVGEMVDPRRSVPRAVFASGAMAGLYFIVLPVVWLGVIGPTALAGDLTIELGPTFAPLFGGLAKGLATGFMVFNMFHGTLQPLSGASRTLAQLAEDGIFPRFLAHRSKHDVPVPATLLTAASAIALLLIGDPIWLIASANFTYLIAIGLPSVAVWLLRRDAPDMERPYRAPRGTLALGLAAAGGWLISAVLGFEQFGLPTVIIGLLMAYSGGLFFAWRKLEDRRRLGIRGISPSLHLTLTVSMIAVLAFDGGGYLIAIHALNKSDAGVVAALQDIFVVVALLTIGAGLALPGMIAQSATREMGLANEALRESAHALNAEIGERKSAEERLLYTASHDELTGLANRAHFMDRFAQMIARHKRQSVRETAVLFLDLDRFKRVNDSLGHLAGDQLLVSVARRLERCLREADALARIGGDEFTILLEDIDGERGACVIAERIVNELAKPFWIAGREMYASTSIGIAMTQIGRDSPEDALRNADIAMYRAKELGRGRYAIFTADLLTQVVTQLQLETDLQGALDRREFVLFYQPIVVLATGELAGFEALIRWEHPQRGLLGPNAFVPAAEENGAILAIGAWVIDEACRQAALWRREYPGRDLAVSVNVSARQFSDGAELLAQIRRGVTDHGIDTRQLHVEITESAIMKDPDVATVVLMELRRMGIEVHIDDFGTGYSSLGYLQRFPVDIMKIDRSFVSLAGRGVGNPEIVRTIASLARGLSLETTAEGIETPEQLAELRALGCTNGQGYLFSRPVRAGAGGDLIAGWTSARGGVTGEPQPARAAAPV